MAINESLAFLRSPVSNASLALFRLGFGLLMAIGALRFFRHGWIESFYILPTFHFTYAGFGWIKPWPAWGMYLHFAVLIVAALGVAAGWRYRMSLAVFLLAFL